MKRKKFPFNSHTARKYFNKVVQKGAKVFYQNPGWRNSVSKFFIDKNYLEKLQPTLV